MGDHPAPRRDHASGRAAGGAGGMTHPKRLRPSPDVVLLHLARQAEPMTQQCRIYTMAGAIWNVCKSGAECNLSDLEAAGFPAREVERFGQLAMAILNQLAPIPCTL